MSSKINGEKRLEDKKKEKSNIWDLILMRAGWGVLVCSCCYNKKLQTGYFINTKNVFSHSLGGREVQEEGVCNGIWR